MESIEGFSKDDLFKSSKILQKTPNQSSLPILKIKQKFDCSQVSPPLQSIVTNLLASTKRKTIAFTSFNVPDFSVDKLSELYDRHWKQQADKKVVYEKKDKVVKKAGAFDDRNFARYANGNECLSADGVPEFLKKKFTEFYVIKNVSRYHE